MYVLDDLLSTLIIPFSYRQRLLLSHQDKGDHLGQSTVFIIYTIKQYSYVALNNPLFCAYEQPLVLYPEKDRLLILKKKEEKAAFFKDMEANIKKR